MLDWGVDLPLDLPVWGSTYQLMWCSDVQGIYAQLGVDLPLDLPVWGSTYQLMWCSGVQGMYA